MENLQSELAGGCSQCCEFNNISRPAVALRGRENDGNFCSIYRCPCFVGLYLISALLALGCCSSATPVYVFHWLAFIIFLHKHRKKVTELCQSAAQLTRNSGAKIPAGFIFRCRLPEEGAATASNHHYSWCMQKWAFPDAPLQGSYRPLSQREENSGQFNIVV